MFKDKLQSFTFFISSNFGKHSVQRRVNHEAVTYLKYSKQNDNCHIFSHKMQL